MFGENQTKAKERNNEVCPRERRGKKRNTQKEIWRRLTQPMKETRLYGT